MSKIMFSVQKTKLQLQKTTKKNYQNTVKPVQLSVHLLSTGLNIWLWNFDLNKSLKVLDSIKAMCDKQTDLSSPAVCQPKCFFHGQYEQWCKSSWFFQRGTWKGQQGPLSRKKDVLLWQDTHRLLLTVQHIWKAHHSGSEVKQYL